jgi:putative restriction endonuclease
MLRAVLHDADDLLREHAIAYVNATAEQNGGVVNRAQLEAFEFQGTPIRLIAPRQGIWKPAAMTAALSFVTTWTPPNERPPYDDDLGADGSPRYKWRGTDPNQHDNVALRRAMELQKPLMWFVGVAPGIYERYPAMTVNRARTASRRPSSDEAARNNQTPAAPTLAPGRTVTSKRSVPNAPGGRFGIT